MKSKFANIFIIIINYSDSEGVDSNSLVWINFTSGIDTRDMLNRSS